MAARRNPFKLQQEAKSSVQHRIGIVGTGIDGFDSLVSLHAHPLTHHVHLVEQRGRIYELQQGRSSVVLDIRARVVPDLDANYEERGLLDAVFAPDSQWLFAFYSRPLTETTTPKALYENVLVRYPRKHDGWDVDSEDVLMRVPKETSYHQGGRLLVFDGYLYVTVGDGGPQGDPNLHAQNLTIPLGKLLRISLDRIQQHLQTTRNGSQQGEFEIAAFGLRNVWAISVDAGTRRLFLADVGWNQREKLHILDLQRDEHHLPLNYGWPLYEGTLHENWFKTSNRRYQQAVRNLQEHPEQLRMPVYEYQTHPGNAIVGGFFVNDEVGYVCGDLIGVLLNIVPASHHDEERTDSWQLAARQPLRNGYCLKSFGRDGADNIYALVDASQGVSSGRAAVWRITVDLPDRT